MGRYKILTVLFLMCVFPLGCSDRYSARVEVSPMNDARTGDLRKLYRQVREQADRLCATDIQLLSDRVQYNSSCELQSFEIANIVGIEAWYTIYLDDN